MKTFEFKSEIFIPRTVSEIFPFFTDARNLDYLTPEWLHFRFDPTAPIAIERGTSIDYRLRVRGVPIRWRSRIAVWDPPYRFVDEQVRGPYRKWIHEHRFRPVDGGTLVEDRVEYAVWGGWLVQRLVIARDITRIFDYRRARLEAYFRDSQRS